MNFNIHVYNSEFKRSFQPNLDTQKAYVEDIHDERFHHEIYLNDFRKCSPEKLKTIIRHPIKLNA